MLRLRSRFVSTDSYLRRRRNTSRAAGNNSPIDEGSGVAAEVINSGVNSGVDVVPEVNTESKPTMFTGPVGMVLPKRLTFTADQDVGQ